MTNRTAPSSAKSKGAIRESAAERLQTPRFGLGLALRRTYRALMSDFQMRLSEQGFTHSEFLYLSLLQRSSLTPGELAHHAGVQKASATDVLKLLTAKGLVERHADTRDSRRQNVALTPRGKKALTALLESAIATNAIARAGISDAAFTSFLDVLRQITANFTSREK